MGRTLLLSWSLGFSLSGCFAGLDERTGIDEAAVEEQEAAASQAPSYCSAYNAFACQQGADQCHNTCGDPGGPNGPFGDGPRRLCYASCWTECDNGCPNHPAALAE